MMEVYVSRDHNGHFRLTPQVDHEASKAPLLFSWRAQGPGPVSFPADRLTKEQVKAWVQSHKDSGFSFRSVTARSA
jgi:hypothetical protein